jgi:hypothetical protein
VIFLPTNTTTNDTAPILPVPTSKSSLLIHVNLRDAGPRTERATLQTVNPCLLQFLVLCQAFIKRVKLGVEV